MNSTIIIGCKTCEKELFKKYLFKNPYRFQPPFPLRTAYGVEDLSDLMLGFTCAFCERRLPITAKMLKFIAVFFDKPFHIDVKGHSIFISNAELGFSVPTAEKINSVGEYLSEYELTVPDEDIILPSEEDIALIQDAAKEFDSSEWSFSLKSGHLLANRTSESYFPFDPKV